MSFKLLDARCEVVHGLRLGGVASIGHLAPLVISVGHEGGQSFLPVREAS